MGQWDVGQIGGMLGGLVGCKMGWFGWMVVMRVSWMLSGLLGCWVDLRDIRWV